MLTPRFNKIVTVSLLGAVMLLSFFALPSLAQDVVQINPVGQELNLAGGAVDGVDSLRDIVLRVIRWILGLVGLIAVIVILYGGFLWMTSAGNADRVTRARAVIVNGLIGLVIIIASFAIVSLVAWFTSDVVLNAPADSCIENEVRACGSCGGTQVCGADGTYGECNAPALCPESAPFGLLSYTPTDNDNPVNTTVKMRFKKDVEDVSNAVVQGYFTLTQVDNGGVSSSVPGVVTYALNSSGQPIKSRLVFTPSAVCSEDATQNCFDKNVAVTVSINDQLKSESGERLTCPASGCTWTFGIGEGFDRDPPTASIVLPRNRAIPQSTNAELRLRALDDYKLSSAWFEVGAGQIIGSMPGFPIISSDYLPANGSPRRIDASAFWNTSSLALFSEHEIKVYADDVAGRGPVEATKIVTVVAPHCDNNTRDGDETDIDCGGSCLACGAPIITRVEPADAAPGDYIQISGRYFGNTPGRIVFSGPDREFGTPDDVVGVTPLACALGDTWTDKQIIIGVPAFAIDADDDGVNDTSYQFDSNILVENSSGDFSDTTSWDSPPLFVNTNVKRPSICSLSKDEIRLCAEGEDRKVQVAGIKFGGNPAGPGRVMFGSFEGFVSEWQTALPQNTAIASLPTIEPGEVGVRVESPVKYCVGGTNAWTACTDNSVCESGECAAPLSNPINLNVLSCTAKPIINAITPTAGPQGQIVTITGSNFGDSPRQVIFRKGANEKSATFDFNNQCSATSYWKNNQIIARVPADIEEGQFDVVVRVQPVPNLIESDPAIFTVNDSDRTPALICALPDNGPIGTSVRFVGESFGDDAGAITFTPNKPATISNGNWEDSVVQTSVPNDAISGSVVATNAGGITSNPVAFTVGSCQQGGCAAGTVCCGDGTCRATREECPVPPAKPLSSYRWRVTTGDPAPRVIEQAQCLVNFVQNWSFENTDDDAGEKKPLNWGSASDLANVDIVDDAPHGDYALLTTADVILNQIIPVPVTVDETLVVKFWAKSTGPKNVSVQLYPSSGSVTPYLDEPVQVNGDWKEYTITGPASNVSSSQLTLIVDTGVHLDRFSIQSSDASSSTTQSPSPFTDTQDACLNTALALRFTTLLGTSPGSLGTVRLLQCTEESCEDTTPVVLPSPTPLGVDGVVVSTPLLLANTWYQASIEGVRSNRGVLMQEPYIWKFKTGGEACAIAGASCSPRRNTLTTSTATVNATAGLQALNCNILTCTSADITWATEGDGVTSLGPVGVCRVPVSVKTPSPREGKDKIRPQVTADPTAVVGMCEIDVKFSPLRVVGVFPNCDVACLNAQPIVALSAEVATVFEGGNEVVGVGNYTFEECVDRSCSQSVDISNDVWLGPIILNPEDARGLKLPIDSNYYAIRFVNNNLDLLPNKFYRVTLLGRDNGLRSIDNKTLEGGTFSWVFGTKDKECGVDRMSLSPKDVTVRTLGAKVRYSTSPFSTGDDCAPGGQLLVATKYNYQWSTLPEGVATLSTLNILPPSPNTDTYLDPVQYATSVGLSEECRQGDSTCDTTVSATELSTNNAGSGLLTLQCGFTPPGACRALSNNLAENGNFEAGADEDDPQWAKGWFNVSLNTLIDGGGAVGGKYFRTDATLDPRYVVTLPTPLTRPTNYTVGFYAKSATPTSPSFVFNDNVANFHTFSETSQADWKYFETTVEAGVGLEEISVDIVSDHDIDGLVIFQHACTNDSSQSCSINAHCQISSTNAPLNLCGIDVDGNGINDPVGTCDIVAGETVGSCNNDENIECRTNNDCKLAVNPNGCCGVRPYVSAIRYANYTDPDSDEAFMCLNTGFDIEFNTLMDKPSLDGKVTLEWLDNRGEQNCVFDEQLAASSTFSRIVAFIKQLFSLDANANNDRWCGVPVSVVSSIKFNDITKQPQYTRVTMYPLQLLSDSGNVVYRIVVQGETEADPTGGVRSIYGVQLSDGSTGNFVQSLAEGVPFIGGDEVLPIGDRICDIERVSVEIDPPLSSGSSLVSTPLQPRDFFQCVGDDCVCRSDTNPDGGNPGEPGCRLTDISTVPVSEDQERTIPEDGNQHIYTAFATTADDLPLSASWSWERIDPQSILRNPVVDDEFTQSVASVTIDPPDGRRRGYAQVRVSASPLGVTEGIGTSNTVNVLFDRCADPWSETLNDTVDNFSTTYCADYGDENTLSDNLPQFILSNRFTTTNSPLNIRSEYILKHPDAVDAIAVRSVSNELHLTPQQWYNEQSFEKGSPRVIDGGVDGYQAIVDGRTAYLGFANVPNTPPPGEPTKAMYTNILIISHSQNAGSDTVEVFKRLIDGILFNTNKLNPGQCRGVQLTCSVNSSENAGNICETDAQCGNGQCDLATELGSCLIDSDCSDGLVCTGEKARISRDLSRFTRLLDVQSKLIDYQYGTSCPNVTPGAPGDADCNGVINGRDVVRAQSYVKATPVAPPAFCKGADFDLNDEVTSSDVGAIQQLVRQQCTRPAGRSSAFPRLNEGTFVENMTTSVWPSWQETFGRDLGGGLPTDPINLFSQCGGGSVPGPFPHSPYTCWDPNTRTYASFNTTLNDGNLVNANIKPDVPAGRVVNGTNLGSHVFTYAANTSGNDYALCSYFETLNVPYPPAIGQVTGASNRVCVASSNSFASGLPPAPPYSVIESFGSSFLPNKAYEVTLTITGSGSQRVTMTEVGGNNEVICEKGSLFSSRCTLFVRTGNAQIILSPDNAMATITADSWINCPTSATPASNLCQFSLNSGNRTIELMAQAKASITVGAATEVPDNTPGPSVQVYVDGILKSTIADVKTATTLTNNVVGSFVELVPNFGNDYLFTNWTGPCAGQGERCVFVVKAGDSQNAVQLNYRARGRLLQVEHLSVAGLFGGSVDQLFGVADATSQPVLTKAECDQIRTRDNVACRAYLDADNNEVIRLEAVPHIASGTTVESVRWFGCDSGATALNICEVTMTSDKTVRVQFGDSRPTLTVVKSAANGARVSTVSTNPAGLTGIECGDGCTTVSRQYQYGNKITLQSTADGRFGSFSGYTCDPAVVGVGTCNTLPDRRVEVTLNGSMTVEAEFTNRDIDLTVNKQVSGAPNNNAGSIEVRDSSGGLLGRCDTGQPCEIDNMLIPIGETSLQFVAVPAAGYSFSYGWSGGCTMESPTACGVTITGSTTAINLNANFTRATANLTLRVRSIDLDQASAGPGTVALRVRNSAGVESTVTVPPSCASVTGIVDWRTCNVSINFGDRVILTAAQNDTYYRHYWGGSQLCTGPSATCEFDMDGTKTVDLTFERATERLNFCVENSDNNNYLKFVNYKGEVTTASRAAEPIFCYSLPVHRNTDVTISAIDGPADNKVFYEWPASTVDEPNACSGTSALLPNCSLTGENKVLVSDSNKTVRAKFVQTSTLSVKKWGTGVGSVTLAYQGGAVIGTRPFSASSGEVVEFSVASGMPIVLSASYPGGGIISTFMCPTSATFGTEASVSVPLSPGTAFCNPVTMTGNMTAQLRFNTPPVFVGSDPSTVDYVLPKNYASNPTENSVDTNISATDADVVIDVFQSFIVNPPTKGTLICNNQNPARKAPTPPQIPTTAVSDCVYTPNPNEVGNDSFTYRFTDGHHNPPAQTVNILILDRNMPPVITATDVKCRINTGTFGPCGTSSSRLSLRDGDSLTMQCSFNDPDLPSDSHSANYNSVTVGAGPDLSFGGVSTPSTTRFESTLITPERNTDPITLGNSQLGVSITGAYPQIDNYNHNGNYLLVYYTRRPSGVIGGSEASENNFPLVIKWGDISIPILEDSNGDYLKTFYGGNNQTAMAVYGGFVPSGTRNLIPFGALSGSFNTTISSHSIYAVSYDNVGSVGQVKIFNTDNSYPSSDTDSESVLTMNNIEDTSIIAGAAASKNLQTSTYQTVLTPATIGNPPVPVNIQESRGVVGGGSTGYHTGVLSLLSHDTSSQTVRIRRSSGTAISSALALIELKKASLDPYNLDLSCEIRDAANESAQGTGYVNVSP